MLFKHAFWNSLLETISQQTDSCTSLVWKCAVSVMVVHLFIFIFKFIIYKQIKICVVRKLKFKVLRLKIFRNYLMPSMNMNEKFLYINTILLQLNIWYHFSIIFTFAIVAQIGMQIITCLKCFFFLLNWKQFILILFFYLLCLSTSQILLTND